MRELRTLLPYLRRYRAGVAAGLVLVLLANTLSLAVPYVLKLGVDFLERPDATRAGVLGYAAVVVFLAVLGGAARYGQREFLNSISRRVEYDLRNDFFRHLLRLDGAFYGRTRTGDIMSRATNDIQAVRMVAGPAYMYLVNTVVMTGFALALMVYISPRLTLLALTPLLLLPPVTLWYGKIIHDRFERIQSHFSDLSTAVQENLSGARIVKAYNQEEPQTRRFDHLCREYLERNMDLVRSSGPFRPLLTLLGGMGMAIVLWAGGRGIVRGEITVGDFIAFSLYLGMLAWPMISLGWVVNLFQRGAASMGRINSVLRTASLVQDPELPTQLPEVRGELEFQAVSFRYPGTQRLVLDSVSFRVPAGSTLAVVGPTGSGKSTLVALLARLYDPSGGKILLDGVPLTELPLEGLRAAIGVVPQDTFLFSDTIRNNLTLGFDQDDEELVESRMRDAARVARLDDTVERFPSGYDTLLGERGINLSGGQRQRATLARAIGRDPRVLILDDALSAVDTHTETEILAGLRGVLAGRTSVVVSHRVSAVMNADHIIVLDDGRLVEQGSHAVLLRLGGLYATLQRRQLLEEDLQAAVAGE